MAKLARKLLTLFGVSGATSNFEQFGSQNAGGAVFTKDVLTIQQLSAWINGWQDAVYATNKAPFLEDMNALHYVAFYEMAYMLQEGIPEYDSTTTYYIGSIVKKTGTAEFYKSIIDNNVGNSLPSKADNSSWQYVIQRGIIQYDATYSYSIGEIAQKPGTAELYKSLINANVGNALPSQTSSAIWQYLVDLANLTPPPVGVSQVKVGFATVSATGSGPTTASVTKVPTSDLGFDPAMTVYAFVVMTQDIQNINTAGSTNFPGFSWSLEHRATMSGTGVDSSGKFLAGGSPANAYTLTLTINFSSSIGSGPNNCSGTMVFIGVK